MKLKKSFEKTQSETINYIHYRWRVGQNLTATTMICISLAWIDSNFVIGPVLSFVIHVVLLGLTFFRLICQSSSFLFLMGFKPSEFDNFTRNRWHIWKRVQSLVFSWYSLVLRYYKFSGKSFDLHDRSLCQQGDAQVECWTLK